MSTRIGSLNHRIHVSNTYKELSKSDERAALALFYSKEYRQSCYFIIQSMEKLIRAKIFSLVNANNEYFRNRNRSHSLEDAVDFLIDVVSTDEAVKAQVTQQLKKYVLGNIHYNYLHNNLRYPSYSKRYDSYSLLQVGKSDCEALFSKMESLKLFLRDIHTIS